MTFHFLTYLWMEFAISPLYFHFHFHFVTKPFWMPMLAEDIRARPTIKSAAKANDATTQQKCMSFSLDIYNTCFVHSSHIQIPHICICVAHVWVPSMIISSILNQCGGLRDSFFFSFTVIRQKFSMIKEVKLFRAHTK